LHKAAFSLQISCYERNNGGMSLIHDWVALCPILNKNGVL